MTESNGQKGHHREVLIVGAGPTGLCTAIELHRHGIPFRLIDKNAQPSPYSKALAIHARTLEIFEIMGVSSALVAHGKKLRDVNISLNGKKLVSWNMDGLETAYPYILSLPQSDTERILIDHLHALGSAVERQVELVGLSQTQSEVTARLRHVDENGDQRIEEVKTPWLIACDGAHSTTRHALSLTFFGSQYPELFLLADAYLDSELSEDGMHLYNGDDGLLAIFPYGNKRFRIIADMPLDLKKEAAVRRISESTGASSKSQSQRALSASSIQSRKEPTQEEMQAIIDRRASSKVKIVECNWLASFTIHQRQVQDYQHGRVILAGDSAHIHSPAGGQGMNTGIQDAFNLGWKLALVMKGVGRPLLIHSYSEERHAVARKVLKMTDFMTRLNTLRNPLARALRNRVAPAFVGQEMLRRRMRDEISELAVNYRNSSIVAEHRVNLVKAGIASRLKNSGPELTEWLTFDTGPNPGDRAPDETVIDTRTQEPTRFFDILKGTDHHLILFAGERTTASGIRQLAEIANFVMDQYGRWIRVHLVALSSSVWGDFPISGTRIADPDFRLHHRYGAACECLYLIRPDGHVAFRSMPADHESLADYVDKILVTPSH